jgi:hypothetical protein
MKIVGPSLCLLATCINVPGAMTGSSLSATAAVACGGLFFMTLAMVFSR